MIRVGVLGAAGKMGSEVCRAVHAAPDLVLGAAIDPFVGDVASLAELVADPSAASTTIDALEEASVDVVVDFTHPDAVADNVRWCLEHGLHVVVGTTGLASDAVDALGELAAERDRGLFIAPNFALGAVLMMRFAAEASKHLGIVEIVELHHDQKADAPSGTSLATAAAIRAARGEGAKRRVESVETTSGARGADVGDGIRIHSVRLPGLVAHQEVILGGPGETLTIRHDSLDRAGFMPGVLLAVRAVGSRPGLTVGLEHLL
jgi:4-hydroxy-tetrahydrodipicolinate reductase